MALNRKVFYDYVRNLPFGGKITPQQFNGLENILNYWEKEYSHWEVRWVAYLLATVFHETAREMQPIVEKGGTKYLKAKKYWPFYGRGLIQITWDFNYERYGIKNTPEKALEWQTALKIAFDGMENGVFTGKRLSQYFNKKANDPEGARKIINGTDKAGLIAQYYKNFLDALEKAQKAVEAPEEVRAPAPKADQPDQPKLTTDPLTQVAGGIGGVGIIASLVQAVSNPWALAAVALLMVGMGVFLVLRKQQANVTGV